MSVQKSASNQRPQRSPQVRKSNDQRNVAEGRNSSPKKAQARNQQGPNVSNNQQQRSVQNQKRK